MRCSVVRVWATLCTLAALVLAARIATIDVVQQPQPPPSCPTSSTPPAAVLRDAPPSPDIIRVLTERSAWAARLAKAAVLDASGDARCSTLAGNDQDGDGAGAGVRIMTINAWNTEGDWEARFAALVETAIANAIDVVAVQELREEADGGRAQAGVLQTLLSAVCGQWWMS
jgi:hypothetical protein